MQIVEAGCWDGKRGNEQSQNWLDKTARCCKEVLEIVFLGSYRISFRYVHRFCYIKVITRFVNILRYGTTSAAMKTLEKR